MGKKPSKTRNLKRLRAGDASYLADEVGIVREAVLHSLIPNLEELRPDLVGRSSGELFERKRERRDRDEDREIRDKGQRKRRG